MKDRHAFKPASLVLSKSSAAAMLPAVCTVLMFCMHATFAPASSAAWTADKARLACAHDHDVVLPRLGELGDGLWRLQKRGHALQAPRRACGFGGLFGRGRRAAGERCGADRTRGGKSSELDQIAACDVRSLHDDPLPRNGDCSDRAHGASASRLRRRLSASCRRRCGSHHAATRGDAHRANAGNAGYFRNPAA